MSRNVTIERCPSNQTTCTKCRSKIGIDTLRVIYHRYFGGTKYFHLRCFKPLEPRPINLEKDVLLKSDLTEIEMGRVKQWGEKWNSKFVITEEKLPEKFKSKGVDTVSTSARRRLLEVFQYLTVREIEVLAALTCKEWFHVSRDEEFWKGKYLLVFQPASTEAEACYRTKYIAMEMGSCWICKKFVELTDMKMICPLRKRPLCNKCHVTDKGSLMSFHSYTKYMNIAPNLSDLLRFPTFKHQNAKTGYVSDLSNVMIPYAEKRRKALLICLETEYSTQLLPSTFDFIKSYSIPQAYQRLGQPSWGKSILMKFFGKNELKEDFAISVAELVKQILLYERNLV